MTTTYGQIAYEAYYAAGGGKSLISGAPLPTWDEQDNAIQSAWNRAGEAVAEVVADAIREAHDG